MIRPVQHQVGRSQMENWQEYSFPIDIGGLQDVPLPGADIHYVLFEAPMQQVLDLLPPSLHPCIPGVVAMTFLKCPESPWGPFECVTVGIGCRSGIRPRFLILSAFASTVEAARQLRERCGYPMLVADVHTQIYYDEIRSTVVQGGRTLLDTRTLALKKLTGSGGSVVYSPTLTMNEVDDERRLVQVDWSADFQRVGRGVTSVETFDEDALIGGSLSPTDAICATLAHADIVLHKPAFTLDPMLLPGKGTVVRLPVAA